MSRRIGSALGVLVVVVALVLLAIQWGSPGPDGAASGSAPAATGTLAEPSARAGSLPPSSPVGPPGSVSPGVPAFGHVFLIVMENHEVGRIIGSDDAPYINGLVARYGLAANYTAITHPSQPNYLALWSGSTQGVGDDRVHDFSEGQTLADQVEAAGRSWHVAAQNVPGGCFTGASASGGEDGPGTYARKHEPAIAWTSVSGNADRCARIVDFSHFDPTLGDFWLIVPNLCNDMHDCSVRTGDRFLESWLPGILDSPAFADGVVFLTFDEGSSSKGGGGQVATIVISPRVAPGARSEVPHDHYSLLRTIEEGLGLPCLNESCHANDLRELFR